MALLLEKYILDDIKAVFPLISKKILDFQMDQYFVTNEKNNVYFYRKGEKKTQFILLSESYVWSYFFKAIKLKYMRLTTPNQTLRWLIIKHILPSM